MNNDTKHSTNNDMPMPQYVSHKKVWALKISSVGTTENPDLVLLVYEDARYATGIVSIVKRPTPQAGWYYVVYEDGYYSFSPADAFESGYTLVGGK